MRPSRHSGYARHVITLTRDSRLSPPSPSVAPLFLRNLTKKIGTQLRISICPQHAQANSHFRCRVRSTKTAAAESLKAHTKAKTNTRLRRKFEALNYLKRDLLLVLLVLLLLLLLLQ